MSPRRDSKRSGNGAKPKTAMKAGVSAKPGIAARPQGKLKLTGLLAKSPQLNKGAKNQRAKRSSAHPAPRPNPHTIAWWRRRAKMHRKPKRLHAKPLAAGASSSWTAATGSPQLDTGLFACGQIAAEPPRAWAWVQRNGGPGDFEFWLHALPGAPGVAEYLGCTATDPVQPLRIQMVNIVDPLNQPMLDPRIAAHRDAFFRAVATLYPPQSVTQNHFAQFLLVDTAEPLVAGFTDPGAVGAERIVGPGVFSVRQTSHLKEPVLPLGWVWQPPNSAEQVWALMLDTPNDPVPPSWYLTGINHPAVDHEFTFEQASPPGWVTGVAPNVVLDKVAFENWIRTTWPHASVAPFEIQHLRGADLP